MNKDSTTTMVTTMVPIFLLIIASCIIIAVVGIEKQGIKDLKFVYLHIAKTGGSSLND